MYSDSTYLAGKVPLYLNATSIPSRNLQISAFFIKQGWGDNQKDGVDERLFAHTRTNTRESGEKPDEDVGCIIVSPLTQMMQI